MQCWEGHLVVLLEQVPAKDGRWTGSAHAYQLDLWGDQPWQVGDNVDCLAQLQEAGHTAEHPKEADQVRVTLVQLFDEAILTAANVDVRRD